MGGCQSEEYKPTYSQSVRIAKSPQNSQYIRAKVRKLSQPDNRLRGVVPIASKIATRSSKGKSKWSIDGSNRLTQKSQNRNISGLSHSYLQRLFYFYSSFYITERC